MKKLISLALSLLFVFGMVACSANDTPAASTATQASTEAAEVEEPLQPDEQEVNGVEEPSEATAIEVADDATGSEELTSVDDSEQKSDTGDAPVYSEGMYKIGNDMPASTYMVFANDGAIISMFTLRDGSGSDANILAIDTFDTYSIIEVSDGQYLELTGAAAADIQATKELVKDDWEALNAGSYLVGFHLEPGEYKILPMDDAIISMLTVYDDCARQKIAAVDTISGSSYVTVKDGQMLSLSGCYISK